MGAKGGGMAGTKKLPRGLSVIRLQIGFSFEMRTAYLSRVDGIGLAVSGFTYFG